jgi:cytochrome c-type biogenesis protein CcmE
MQSRTIKVLITVAVILGGAGMLIYSSMADAELYKYVHEITEQPEEWAGKSIRVHGYVEAGSIHEEIVGQQTRRSFILESPCPSGSKQIEGCTPGQVKRLRVENAGPKPDTFKELAEVVAKGRLEKVDGEYVFQASELMAKCPSKYEENQRPSTMGGETPAPNLLPEAEERPAPTGQGAY